MQSAECKPPVFFGRFHAFTFEILHSALRASGFFIGLLDNPEPPESSRQSATVDTSRGLSVSKNRRVVSRSDLPSIDSIHKKNRLRLASANRATLNTGWYGIGKPLSASIPNTA